MILTSHLNCWVRDSYDVRQSVFRTATGSLSAACPSCRELAHAQASFLLVLCSASCSTTRFDRRSPVCSSCRKHQGWCHALWIPLRQNSWGFLMVSHSLAAGFNQRSGTRSLASNEFTCERLCPSPRSSASHPHLHSLMYVRVQRSWHAPSIDLLALTWRLLHSCATGLDTRVRGGSVLRQR